MQHQFLLKWSRQVFIDSLLVTSLAIAIVTSTFTSIYQRSPQVLSHAVTSYSLPFYSTLSRPEIWLCSHDLPPWVIVEGLPLHCPGSSQRCHRAFSAQLDFTSESTFRLEVPKRNILKFWRYWIYELNPFTTYLQYGHYRASWHINTDAQSGSSAHSLYQLERPASPIMGVNVLVKSTQSCNSADVYYSRREALSL